MLSFDLKSYSSGFKMLGRKEIPGLLFEETRYVEISYIQCPTSTIIYLFYSEDIMGIQVTYLLP